ncbi:GNAT family N-acetyltransferase [Luedemannella helvata]|uniref:N-acetyltransferase domain-containing protein n=1 Tax=Luedemannella helvata TaxID=349315 RepID=A0ABN2L4U7_9ACTN
MTPTGDAHLATAAAVPAPRGAAPAVTEIDPGVVAQAADIAERAAADRGLVVRELDSVADLDALALLFQRVWSAPNVDQVINCATMRALVHVGNYVVGAYRSGELIGGSVAFFGLDGDGIVLHSHLAGVVPGGQGQGVGRVLKLHQRAWALRRGIRRVTWTYDPLLSRNAYFNLQKLGGLPVAYEPDFYGVLDDGINTGDATDRLVLLWEVDSPRAVAAARGELTSPDAAALRSAGATVLVDRTGDDPVSPDEGSPPSGPALLVALPADIEAMRPSRPEVAAAWRYAVRDALSAALAAGYRFDGFDRAGWYVLVSDERRSGQCD